MTDVDEDAGFGIYDATAYAEAGMKNLSRALDNAPGIARFKELYLGTSFRERRERERQAQLAADIAEMYRHMEPLDAPTMWTPFKVWRRLKRDDD